MNQNLDYDDYRKLEEMCQQSDYILGVINHELRTMSQAEIDLDIAIAGSEIKDTLTWKKQVNCLMKIDEKYKTTYISYIEAKTNLSVHQNLLRALETRINCLKKKITSTPSM